MLWSYLIHLGSNMWDDEQATRTTPPYTGEPIYRPRLLCDGQTWREVTDFIAAQGLNALIIDLGEGVRYASHPELAAEGAWTRDELKSELQRLRGLGLEPIPKLNFSACHDLWLGKYRMMRCTDTYYAVCHELIDEVCELFGHPAYFHLGMDEEAWEYQKHFGSAFVRGEELWWHDLYDLQSRCEKNGARAWVWSDYYWRHPDIFARRMPKEILQSNWSYHRMPLKGADGRYPDVGYQAYLELDRLGYDQVPTGSTWSFFGNIEQTVNLGFEELHSDRLAGFMAAPWLFTIEENKYGLMNDAWRLGKIKAMREGQFTDRRF